MFNPMGFNQLAMECHQSPPSMSILLIREGNATHILFVIQSLSDLDNPFTY